MFVPREESFTSHLRSPAVASRIGIWLGICFGLAIVTGVISHFAQAHVWWFPYPTSPSWGYRVTQGVHVISGTAAVPLLLVKLWTVFPKLFARVPRSLRALSVDAVEKASIGVLVAAAVFQLVTGLANSAQWYPWSFSFRSTHYAGATWTGVPVRDLLDLVDAPPGSEVTVTSLQPGGAFRKDPSPRELHRPPRHPAGPATQGGGAQHRPRLSIPADRLQPARCVADEVGPHGGGDRVTTRLIIAALGLVDGSYGLITLLNSNWSDLISIWLAGGIVADDFLLAPLTLALVAATLTVLPQLFRAVGASALVVVDTVTIAAIPVLGRFGCSR